MPRDTAGKQNSERSSRPVKSNVARRDSRSTSSNSSTSSNRSPAKESRPGQKFEKPAKGSRRSLLTLSRLRIDRAIPIQWLLTVFPKNSRKVRKVVPIRLQAKTCKPTFGQKTETTQNLKVMQIPPAEQNSFGHALSKTNVASHELKRKISPYGVTRALTSFTYWQNCENDQKVLGFLSLKNTHTALI